MDSSKREFLLEGTHFEDSERIKQIDTIEA